MVILWGEIRWVSCGEDGFEIERVTWVADGFEIERVTWVADGDRRILNAEKDG